MVHGRSGGGSQKSAISVFRPTLIALLFRDGKCRFATDAMVDTSMYWNVSSWAWENVIRGRHSEVQPASSHDWNHLPGDIGQFNASRVIGKVIESLRSRSRTQEHLG